MDKELAELFGFTAEDLEANRGGYLTKQQLSSLRSDIRETLAIFRAILIGLPILGFIFILNNAILHSLIFAAFEGLAFFLYQMMKQQAKTPLKSGDLRKLEGALWKEIRIPITNTTGFYGHYIGVGDKQFLVSIPQFNALTESELYTLYFTEHRIWSCERLKI